MNPARLLEELKRHTSTLRHLEIHSIQKEGSWTGTSGSGSGAFENLALDQDQAWASGEREIERLDAAQVRTLAAWWRKTKARYIQPIDLRNCTVLKHLSCHITDLAGAMIRANPMAGIPLFTVLPSSIESLKLTYSGYFDDHESQWGPQNGSGFSPADDWGQKYYTHLREVISRKEELFPSLERIELCLEEG